MTTTDVLLDNAMQDIATFMARIHTLELENARLREAISRVLRNFGLKGGSEIDEVSHAILSEVLES